MSGYYLDGMWDVLTVCCSALPSDLTPVSFWKLLKLLAHPFGSTSTQVVIIARVRFLRQTIEPKRHSILFTFLGVKVQSVENYVIQLPRCLYEKIEGRLVRNFLQKKIVFIGMPINGGTLWPFSIYGMETQLHASRLGSYSVSQLQFLFMVHH